MPIFAGTCANETQAAVDLARRAVDAGVDALTVLTPFAVKLNQEELFTHFSRIAAAVDVPVLLYNNPRLTGVTVEPATAARLAEECTNVRGIKDSSGSLESIRAFIEATPDDFTVLNGYDAMLLDALRVGAAGGVSGSANVLPRVCATLYEAFRRGDLEAARVAQAALARFREAWALGTPPAVIKAGVELRGIPVGAPRPPVMPLDEKARGRLADLMRQIDAAAEV